MIGKSCANFTDLGGKKNRGSAFGSKANAAPPAQPKHWQLSTEDAVIGSVMGLMRNRAVEMGP